MSRAAVLLAFLCLLALPGAAIAAPPFVHQPRAQETGAGGAAATVDSVATDAAIATLRRGGNAVDAAVSAAAVLGVTEPFSCGIGGGGFMVIRRPGGGVTTIDHREAAPSAMRPDSFWEGGAVLPFDDARFSGPSAGVPGTVEGWDEALRRYGTFSLSQALRPAARVARLGFLIDPTFFGQVEQNVDYFDDVPSTSALYLDPDGTPHDMGTVQRNPDLARTYRRIGRLGSKKGFYRGPVADAMVEAVRRPPIAADANHLWRPGVMSARDLKRYAAPERRPARVGYRGLDVFGMGPPSSGGSTVGEALNILEGYDLGSLSRVQALHLFLEASRFAFADRGAYLADEDFFDVPLAGLLSDGFAATRREEIDPSQAATSPVEPGDPAPFDDGDASGEASVSATRAGTTTHVTVADGRGNVVSYTFTIESTGGNGITVPGFGFLLNNELTDFNIDSLTHPNRVEGGKRPRSSMSPTIVIADGRPLLALGSPGGSTIIPTVLQILLDRLDLGLALPEAIADPRASQRNTPATTAEPTFISSAEGQALAADYGHAFSEMAEIGAATAIEFLAGGRLLAAAEPARRGGGSARVVAPGD